MPTIVPINLALALAVELLRRAARQGAAGQGDGQLIFRLLAYRPKIMLLARAFAAW